MKRYRIKKQFAWKPTQVVVFIGSRIFIHKNVRFRFYYKIEVLYGNLAGLFWEDYEGAYYRDEEAAQLVCEYLEKQSEKK